MKHPTTVAGLTPERLAEEVSRMRYDALAEFLGELGARLERDALADLVAGRDERSKRLRRASELVGAASPHVAGGRKPARSSTEATDVP